jgi:hypothetical protein
VAQGASISFSVNLENLHGGISHQRTRAPARSERPSSPVRDRWHHRCDARSSGAGPDAISAILAAVASFSGFDADNDPYGEHDCAVLTAGAERMIWKIDHYDRSLSGHSPNPADPAVTTRAPTIMLAEEY